MRHPAPLSPYHPRRNVHQTGAPCHGPCRPAVGKNRFLAITFRSSGPARPVRSRRLLLKTLPTALVNPRQNGQHWRETQIFTEGTRCTLCTSNPLHPRGLPTLGIENLRALPPSFPPSPAYVVFACSFDDASECKCESRPALSAGAVLPSAWRSTARARSRSRRPEFLPAGCEGPAASRSRADLTARWCLDQPAFNWNRQIRKVNRFQV